ncbi:hypothetical protein R3P38DRAFT_3196045 [Favolaschia claudopus]|uniref:Uncharacterized protein n=1 Tax=Favolaschia claudopus TaxID=2862362 RepID=A0AAW0BCS5_9AGAR
MSLPLTTEPVLAATARMLRILFGSPTTLQGVLIATGIRRPMTVRIPSFTGTVDGVCFEPWFGVALNAVHTGIDLSVISPPTGRSTTADLGIAVVHIDQRNNAGHPANMAINRRFSNLGINWYGNVILLEIDLQTMVLKSLERENMIVAFESLDHLIQEKWRSRGQESDLTDGADAEGH